MHQDNTVDLGVVQIHKKVIGDIAAASIKEVPGAQLATFGIIGSMAEAFGYKNRPIPPAIETFFRNEIISICFEAASAAQKL